MRRRYRRNGLVNDVTNLGLAGGGLAVGSAVVSSIPGDASAAVGSGMVQGAGYFSPMYGLVAMRYVINQSRNLDFKRRRKRR